MKKKTNTIGSFEAKTHLSQLLEDVQGGAEITITKRGKPVALLIPYRDHTEKMNRKDIIKKFNEIRRSVTGTVNIKDMVVEGRKY